MSFFLRLPKIFRWMWDNCRRYVESQTMTMLVAQEWRGERDKERERSGGAESTVTSVLCLHYDPSGESQRCMDATHKQSHTLTHTPTPVPGEALKYSTQHIRRAMRTHTYPGVHTHNSTSHSPPVLTKVRDLLLFVHSFCYITNI